ncbi:hypothetical protein GCK72_023728 [Caenorhabditis remanei]|uniref:Uncharacterized protein n=1 Tax=Caenorhabditis remanei TaxID=31234 RepID=A0A6A5FXE4_CAERE|nr:hypothetical protein GCK72_023728 [Caenorhabditis remanei]KAF1747266.1 hypothetical protein GCK72_023728 [Caenorhabditis remanei]
MNTFDIPNLKDAFNSTDLGNATNSTAFGESRIITKDPYSAATIIGLITTGPTITAMYKTRYCNSYVAIILQMLTANMMILLGVLGASLFPVGT